ncbi:O-antigen ligase family protein [Janibacter sp. GS2]|uniref:O-antigen ligase family protein n=1 Tax=Janibacter sp. GS2 TaxID=3442646 RepID=UPI003EBF9043
MLGLSGGSPRAVSALRWGFLAALLTTGAVGLWEISTGSHLREFSDGAYAFSASSIASTFINPNNYGAFLLGTLGPTLMIIARVRNLLPQLIVCFILAGSLLLAINTESRGAVFGIIIILAIASVALAAFNVGYFITATLVASPIVIVGSLLFTTRIRLVIENITSGADASSDATRVLLGKQAITYLFESGGVGKGPGSFLATLEMDSDWASVITPAHNTFAQTGAEYGLPGLVALLVILGTSMATFLTPSQSGAQRLIQFEMVVCFSALCGAALIASSVLGDPSWWVLIGYLLCLTWQFRNISAIPTFKGPSA